MLDRPDQLQLLSLIESELSAADAAAVRSRLAGDARALAFIDGAIADRAALRALPEPELPVDFAAQLEPMLARPMLMESAAQTQAAVALAKPGQFRRQHRRINRRIRWSRLAAVAIVMFSLIGGIWAAVNAWLLPDAGSSDANRLVSGSTTNDNETKSGGMTGVGGTGNSQIVAAKLPQWTPGDGTIHHYMPLPVDVDDVRVAMTTSSDTPKPAVAAADAPPVPELPAAIRAAEFAIVLRAKDASTTEAAIGRAMEPISHKTALVKNFSFAEARQLALAWERDHAGAGSPGNQPMVADVDGGKQGNSAKLLADRVRQQLTAANRTPFQPESTPLAMPASGLIAGSKEFAPSLEQQLDFSSRGATLTIAVPASKLNEFIERLSVNEGLAASLLMLPPMDWSTFKSNDKVDDKFGGLDSSVPSALAWITDGPRVKQAMKALRESKPEVIVMVPVVIRVDSARN